MSEGQEGEVCLATVLRCDCCREGEAVFLHHSNPASLSIFPIAFRPPFASGKISSAAFAIPPLVPGESWYLIQHPASRAAAAWGCNVSGRCWDLTLLPSGFAAERSLINRKQRKAVRKCDICVVLLRAELHCRQLGSGACFGGRLFLLEGSGFYHILLILPVC